MTRPPPSPRKSEKAGLLIVVTLIVVVTGFFVTRIFWHAEVRERDPESLEAPDRQNDGSSAPAAQ